MMTENIRYIIKLCYGYEHHNRFMNVTEYH